jgi:hypothetical protein
VAGDWLEGRSFHTLVAAAVTDERSVGVNLDSVLVRHFRTIRDGKRHVLLVGFPMPERVVGRTCRMHWQPVYLPVPARGPRSLPRRLRTRDGSRRTLGAGGSYVAGGNGRASV